MNTDRRLYSMDLGRREHTRWLGSNRYAGGAPPLTLPTANLLAAYDARVGVTNVSGACSAWADQSGNGKHATQGTAGSRPTISTTDGFASLLFDGTADFLNVPSITASSGTKTVYAVCAPTYDATLRALFDVQSGRMLLGASASKYAGFDSSSAIRDTGVAVSTALQRVTYEVSGSIFSFWKDGVAATPATWSGATPIGGTVMIGRYYIAAAGFYPGHLLALYIYTAARSTAVEDYITQEWGV